jgi:hypothetical protein
MLNRVISINPHQLWEDSEITADMYLFLLHLKEVSDSEGEITAPFFLQVFPTEYIDYLVENDYIMNQNGEFILKPKGFDLFHTTDSIWYEFMSIFPHKVPSGTGGFRPLRALDPDAKSNQKAKKKYLSIVKNNLKLHEHIMKVLSLEISYRKNHNQMMFMHNLETWLNQRDWEKFEYLLEEENYDDVNHSDYGEKLI